MSDRMPLQPSEISKPQLPSTARECCPDRINLDPQDAAETLHQSRDEELQPKARLLDGCDRDEKE